MTASSNRRQKRQSAQRLGATVIGGLILIAVIAIAYLFLGLIVEPNMLATAWV